MKKSDFQLIGYIGIALGVVFLLGGVGTYYYYEVHHTLFGDYAVCPYQEYSGGLLVAAAVLLVIGVAFLWRAQQEGAPTQTTFPKPA